MNQSIGFIIIRNINSYKTLKYWYTCYKCIRNFYKEKIVIIDDNSDKELLNSEENITNEKKLENYIIQYSEFPKRGEFLPYYYFYKNHYFDNAVIIHDSTFIQSNINFNITNKVKFLWTFKNIFDENSDIVELLQKMDNSEELINFFYNKNYWKGCFGSQMIINYNLLYTIQEKHNFLNLKNYILNRKDRCSFERIIGLLCCYYDNNIMYDISFFNDIHQYCNWGYTFEEYINDNNKNDNNKSIIKVWTGR